MGKRPGRSSSGSSNRSASFNLTSEIQQGEVEERERRRGSGVIMCFHGRQLGRLFHGYETCRAVTADRLDQGGHAAEYRGYGKGGQM